MAVHCPECAFVNAEGANYCQKCGAFLGSNEAGEEASTMTYTVNETGDMQPIDLDDVVTKVRLRRDAETPGSLRALAAEWTEALGLPDDGLEEATAAWTGSAGQEWTSEVGGRRVSLDITSRDHAIVWASIDVPDGAIR